MTKEVKKPTAISMTDSLKQKLKEAAEKDGRSFSDYICRLLEKQV